MSISPLRPPNIQIWHCEVKSGIDWDSVAGFRKYLSTTEQTQISSFSHAPQKFEFIISKALLRNRLAFYLQQPPAEIAIVKEAMGRPVLEINSGLSFNISHCKGLISCAFSTTPELGLDIENTTRHSEYSNLANEVFSLKELQTLKSYGNNNTSEIFFKNWTLKEAYLKALGTGVVDQIKEITIEIDSTLQSALLKETFPGIDHGNDWNFYMSQPTKNHQLALAHRWQSKEKAVISETFLTLKELETGLQTF